jgi:hypothetical protein
MKDTLSPDADKLAAACPLPEGLVRDELSNIIALSGQNPATITLDELREVLAAYLQDVMVLAKEHYSAEET